MLAAATPGSGVNDVNSFGIVASHAYAILSVIDNKKHGKQMLKLRNPWGEKEWRGNWKNMTKSLYN